MELRSRALQVLLIAEPQAKALAARELYDAAIAADAAHTAQPEGGDAAADTASLDIAAILTPDTEPPGRPERPRLLAALQVGSRSPFTPEGRAALIHAIAHIEFNAIKNCLHIGIKSPRSTTGLMHANRIQLHPLQLR